MGVAPSAATTSANVRFRRNLAVHQGVDESRVAALLRTSIIAACTIQALASCLTASWMEARAGVAQHSFGSCSERLPVTLVVAEGVGGASIGCRRPLKIGLV
jgi:hypothetical protein